MQENKKYDDKQENFRDYDGKKWKYKIFHNGIADVINNFLKDLYTPALGRDYEIMQKAVVDIFKQNSILLFYICTKDKAN